MDSGAEVSRINQVMYDSPCWSFFARNECEPSEDLVIELMPFRIILN